LILRTKKRERKKSFSAFFKAFVSRDRVLKIQVWRAGKKAFNNNKVNDHKNFYHYLIFSYLFIPSLF
jgi:hypothetical protein